MRSEQSDLAIFSTSSRNASLFCCIHFKTTTLYRNFLSSALAVLHRLIDMEPYPGKVFLLRPIFWRGANPEVFVAAKGEAIDSIL